MNGLGGFRLDVSLNCRLRMERAALESRLKQLNEDIEPLKEAPPRGKAGAPPARQSASLLMASLEGDLPSVRAALASGTDPDSRSADGPALLLAAISQNNATIVRELLHAGASVDACDEAGTTSLIACVRDDCLGNVKEFLRCGANVNARNMEGDTPLTNAACWGSARVVECLLKHGADPKLPDGLGVSPEEIARQQGHLKIAKTIRRVADSPPKHSNAEP